jgi:hypothetical protein
MSNRTKIRTITVVVVLAITCFAPVFLVAADEWFDSFGRLSKNDELARFTRLAVFLREHPETIGFIAFCTGPHDRNSTQMHQKTRGINFIVSRFKIPRSRIRVIDYGRCRETTTILEPVDRAKPIPQFF